MKKLLIVLFALPVMVLAQTEDKVSTATDSVGVPKKELIEVTPEKSKPVKPECVKGDCVNGKGEMKFSSGSYNGQWKDGLRNGYGVFSWDNGDVYKGNWVEDKRHGAGEYTWHDGSRYKGNYSHGIRSGYGIYYYTNGTIYEGTWQNNLKHGIANFYYKQSVNLGGKYFNNEYVSGTGVNQESYNYKPSN